MPRISSTAPKTKPMSRLLGTGEMVKQRRKTMPVTGRTEERDSFSFSTRMVRFFFSSSRLDFLTEHLAFSRNAMA